VRRPTCVGSIVIWFPERSKIWTRVNEENVVEEIEVIEFWLETNEQDLEEVVMETDSICYCQYTIHSNEEVMKYRHEIVSIDLMIN
jgi:hypothetical protein